MKFTLTQADLDKAVRAYIRGLMTISEDTMITVDVRSSKGETITEVNLYSPDENGNYDIPEAAPAVAKAALPSAPAPVADGEAPKRRGRPPKAAPVEEVAPAPISPVTQAEEPAEEYEEEPTKESTEEVEETAPVAATFAPAPVAAPVAQSQAPVSAAVPPKRTPLFGARKAG